MSNTVKYLKFAYHRDGKPTGRVVAVRNPASIDQRANKGIPFKRVQQLVNTMENSPKWERVANNTPEAEGNSTRVRRAKHREQLARVDQDREQRAHVATAEAIAKAVKGA